ncbi:MAG TPA: hypothetical protein VMA74_20340 [Dyella sp.]|uniref:hypothetical protein n=1 Tax=Dyella sp. TaxID=1869338 RepID=UPI002B8BF593|nr:hypothetical protein [Dyella sp.]HUB92084.1 hypothetical protein [Dyella sp.]
MSIVTDIIFVGVDESDLLLKTVSRQVARLAWRREAIRGCLVIIKSNLQRAHGSDHVSVSIRLLIKERPLVTRHLCQSGIGGDDANDVVVNTFEAIMARIACNTGARKQQEA